MNARFIVISTAAPTRALSSEKAIFRKLGLILDSNSPGVIRGYRFTLLTSKEKEHHDPDDYPGLGTGHAHARERERVCGVIVNPPFHLREATEYGRTSTVFPRSDAGAGRHPPRGRGAARDPGLAAGASLPGIGGGGRLQARPAGALCPPANEPSDGYAEGFCDFHHDRLQRSLLLLF